MRTGLSYKLKLALLPLVVFPTMGGNLICTDEYDPSQFVETPPDHCPSWDTDCDAISTATETNNANAYLNLDTSTFDPNPSLALGQPRSGTLSNGLNLVNQGPGYYHYINDDSLDSDDWGVLHTINMIEGAGRDWLGDDMTPPRVGVGDLSLRYGGPWPDHSSHQNGLDVDIRYVRNDDLDTTLNIAEIDSVYYDLRATIILMNCLVDNGNIQVIFHDSVHSHVVGGPLMHWPGHSTHFHVRIEDPDGTSN